MNTNYSKDLKIKILNIIFLTLFLFCFEIVSYYAYMYNHYYLSLLGFLTAFISCEIINITNLIYNSLINLTIAEYKIKLYENVNEMIDTSRLGIDYEKEIKAITSKDNPIIIFIIIATGLSFITILIKIMYSIYQYHQTSLYIPIDKNFKLCILSNIIVIFLSNILIIQTIIKLFKTMKEIEITNEEKKKELIEIFKNRKGGR